METFETDNYMDIQFEYEFESLLDDPEGSRYIQDINARIVRLDDSRNNQVIGQSNIKMLLLEQAIKDEYSVYDVFDTYEYTRRIGNMIYDFEIEEIKEDLQKKLFGAEPILNTNICIFEKIKILPEYRGLGLGAKFIKNKYDNFSAACGLIVMQPFPLQLEYRHPQPADSFESKMNYASMEQNESKAAKSLKAFYKRVGFISVKGYNELMFLLPGLKNPKLEAIDMNEILLDPNDGHPEQTRSPD